MLAATEVSRFSHFRVMLCSRHFNFAMFLNREIREINEKFLQ